MVHVHALGSFRLHSTLSKSKGCEAFAVNKNSSPLRLAMYAKKRLIIYEWDGKQFNELRVSKGEGESREERGAFVLWP